MKRVLLGGLCLLIVARPAPAQSDVQKKQTIAYLQKLQTDDGGFRASAAAKESNLPATTSAFRALKYFGGAPRDKDACIAFVWKCFDKDGGGFAARPGGKATYQPTAVGIMAVVDLKMSTEPYADAVIKYLDEHSKTFEEVRLTAASFESLGKRPPHAEAWLKQIAMMRHADGTYGEGDGVARDTGGAVCAVLRLGGTVEQRDNVLKVLNGGLRKDGGFGQVGADGSDLATSYRVMRAFHMLKTQPERAGRLRDFIARCRNDDGGYGVAPGQPSNVSGCYYAGIILHWLDEK
ncbi:MAG TPA: prenyltransferase/squalene oxidase repeat-containing protein [Gemmataceae bacterium]